MSINITTDFIGESAPVLHREKISLKLSKYNLHADLPQDIVQDDWRVQIPFPFEPTFYWSAHLTPEDGLVADQHAFRAPAVILSNDQRMLAVIPDLALLKTAGNRWYMDMDAPSKMITLGVSNSETYGHTFYRKTAGNIFRSGTFRFGFYTIESTDACDLANPFRAVHELLWGTEGVDHLEELPRTPLLPYVEHTYRWAFKNWVESVWQEFSLDGVQVGAPVFIVNYSQSPGFPGKSHWREDCSIWNQAWFHSLRSAAGQLRYARLTGDEELARKAQMTKELALHTPKTADGLFYSVAATRMRPEEGVGSQSEGWSTLYWGNSNRNPVTWSIEQSPFHIVDMSITATQMLRWYTELEQDERLLVYACEYADALLKLQGKDGFFPAWIDHDGNLLDELQCSPETSASVTFLSELYSITKDERYKAAAVSAMEAVIREIVFEGRWEDFETYWSCSRWGGEYLGKKVPRNQMHKHCSFSIAWTAEALAALYQLEHTQRYLDLGQRVLDELLMYQAVWQPPYLHAPVFGGFAVMNADAEWLDARQSLFVELMAQYSVLTGLKEYRQRAAAAMRSAFAMMYCPENPEIKALWEQTYPYFSEKDYGFTMENYGHGGIINEYNSGMGDFTIYDWGNGNASAAFMRNRERFGDLFAQYGCL